MFNVKSLILTDNNYLPMGTKCLTPSTPISDHLRQNASSQYQHNIKQTSDGNKENYNTAGSNCGKYEVNPVF